MLEDTRRHEILNIASESQWFDVFAGQRVELISKDIDWFPPLSWYWKRVFDLPHLAQDIDSKIIEFCGYCQTNFAY